MNESTTGVEKKYIPPLVRSNNFELYNDVQNTLNETNVDIGGYIRISTRKDSQKSSIDNQKEIIKEWAALNGYNIVDFYIDVKTGAYTYLRDDMKRLKEAVKNKVIKGVIAKEISRTSRDIMDILELKRSLAVNGAFFISIKENYDSRTDDDEFLLVIHAGLAQKERKTTASRVKLTQMLKAKKGHTNVPSPAFGYKLSEDKQHLVVNPETVEIYKFITDKFLEGWGRLKICKYLNSQNIHAKRSDKWHTNSVTTILTNPVYLGITIYNTTTLIRDESGRQKRVVRPEKDWIIRHNTHQPLITEEKFERIQEIIKKRKEEDKKEWACTKKYLLSGILYCDVCNGKLYGSKISRNRRKDSEPYVHYSYVDQNRYGVCDTKTKYWNMEKVDTLVMNEIKNFFQDKLLIEQRIRAKQYMFNQNLNDDKAERENQGIRLNKVNKAIKMQQEAYENEIITTQEYKQRMSELRSVKSDILMKIDSLNKKLDKVDSIEERFNHVKTKLLKVIENLDTLDYETKEIVIRKIVKRIFIKQDYTIRIEYTFEE